MPLGTIRELESNSGKGLEYTTLEKALNMTPIRGVAHSPLPLRT